MEQKIKCKDCGETFTITQEELKWYEDKGFKPPKRCKSCRKFRKEMLKGGEKDV